MNRAEVARSARPTEEISASAIVREPRISASVTALQVSAVVATSGTSVPQCGQVFIGLMLGGAVCFESRSPNIDCPQPRPALVDCVEKVESQEMAKISQMSGAGDFSYCKAS